MSTQPRISSVTGSRSEVQASVSRVRRWALAPSMEMAPGLRGAEVSCAEPLVTKTMLPRAAFVKLWSGPGSFSLALWTMMQMEPGGQFPARPAFRSTRKPAPRSASVPTGTSGVPQLVSVTWSPQVCSPQPL